MNSRSNTPRRSALFGPVLWLAAFLCAWNAGAQTDKKVIFERISQYHHIQVYEEDGYRMLSFNGSWETRMSLDDPSKGHFEYTEYFQMPFIWNPNIKHVLMAGLGGGSTQRAYQKYYTNVMVDTVEIDPVVVSVAEQYFHVAESPTLHFHTNDARQFMRLSTNTYDVILMDAYTTTRYGSSLPPHLTTREFFEIADKRLSTNGILAYNVIGQIKGERQNLLGALYHTLKQVFPQVYLFPAEESQNVVFVATKNPTAYTWSQIQLMANDRVHSHLVTLPSYYMRARQCVNEAPPNALKSIILTDDYCPIESLMDGSN